MNDFSHLLVDKVDIGIIVINKNFEICLWNKWLEKYTNIFECDVVGQSLFVMNPIFQKPYYKNIFENAFKHGQSMFCSGAIHSIFIHKFGDENGETTKQNMKVEPLEINNETYVILQINDTSNQHRQVQMLKTEISERKKIGKKLLKLNEELQDINKFLQQLSMFDGLTGISNRRKFDEYCQSEWNRMKRSKSPLSIIMLDIDHFKEYNDTYGHLDGDDALKCVVNVLSDSLKRSTDLIARYGGEEFIVILPETQYEGALFVGEQLRANVENHQIPHKTSLINDVITISVGVVTIDPADQKNQTITLAEFLEEADKMLYESKKNGRNCVTGRFL